MESSEKLGDDLMELTSCQVCGKDMGVQTGYVKKACSRECRSLLRGQSISKGKKGKRFTEEHRRSLSKAAKLRWESEEERVKCSLKQIENWSSEQYRKMQEEARRSHLNFMKLRESSEHYSGEYVVVNRCYGHPLANSVGQVSEHRKVLYDKIGPGPHLCHWGCGKMLEWGGVEGICSDHLDGNRKNNDPDNLVPSCLVCNFARGRSGNPLEWSYYE